MLSLDRMAKRKAREVLLETWMQTRELPVPLVSISATQGVRVFKQPDLGVECRLEQVAGVPHITYNSSSLLVRSRFAIAHALGHVCLQQLGTDGPQDYTKETYILGNPDPLERAANAFAMELLMPEEMVRSMFKAPFSLPELAEMFGVSEVALLHRMKDLGLVS